MVVISLDKQPDDIKITPIKTKIKARLYLFQVLSGNQKMVLDQNGYKYGSILVNDWDVYNSPGPNKRVVARAQGLHINASMSNDGWYHVFHLVFQNDRFKNSTLEVRGKHVIENGQWAIVGGTGEFARANGIIEKKLQQAGNTRIVELAISATCGPF